MELSPVQNIWKPDLYYMQLAAPIPKPVLCNISKLETSTKLFGKEYHGHINYIRANNIMQNADEGSYLIRSSKIANGDFYTLSLKFDNKVHHYKLHIDDFDYVYVRKKRYKSVYSLVADGLITMYLKLRAPVTMQTIRNVKYHESPYMTLNKKKLGILAKEPVTKIKKPLNDLTISAPIPSTPMTPIVALDKFGKSHAFKLNTFKGLNWCELCGNFLWGFTAQGVKCEDCGFIAHSKCSERVPSDCVPDLKHVRGVFGIDLTTLITTIPLAVSNEHGVPFIVEKCAMEIEARGLMSEGIYRLSGFQDEVEALKLAFDKDGDNTNLSENSNINVVAGTLKLYFRLLPIPLITLTVYNLLIKTTESKALNDKLEAIKRALVQLPPAHLTTLKYLIKHLNRVSLHQAINKMSAQNLATVFAPTLIRQQQSHELVIFSTPDIISDIFLLETLISHSNKIFS